MGGTVHLVPPAIDPLAPKNMALSPEDAAYVCQQFGVDVDRPLLLQVSRFDPWKDPIGVIDAYRAVKEEIPGVQLALVGSMATDDPEGWEFFNETLTHADDDEDIKILNNFNGVGNIEVNAFQAHADVVIQKSTREGFGLTVTEALWKGKAFIGGNVGGIPLQIQDGETGFLVDSPEECAQRCIELLTRPGPRPRVWAGRARSTRGATSSHRATCATTCGCSARWPTKRRLSGMDGSGETPVVLVSNRGPVTFEDDGTVRRGTGGLVTALTGLASHRHAVWVASAMTEADAVRAQEAGQRPFAVRSPTGGEYLVRLVESDPVAYDRFYNIFANPMLWFIQHYLWDLSNAPDVRRNEIEAFEYGYNVVNEDLATAVLEEIDGRPEPLVMVHDYHLYTLPALLRRARPDVFLHHFIHIPWTQSDSWRVLPNRIREELFHGLLANDIIGFHTQAYRRNFLQCCRDLLDLDVDFDRGIVHHDGPRGVGAQLPAADRRRRDAEGRRSPSARSRSRRSCCAAGASS